MNKDKLLDWLEGNANEWAGDIAYAQARDDDDMVFWYAGAIQVTNVLIEQLERGLFDD